MAGIVSITPLVEILTSGPRSRISLPTGINRQWRSRSIRIFLHGCTGCTG